MAGRFVIFVLSVIAIAASLTEARYYGQEQQRPADIGQVSQQQSAAETGQVSQQQSGFDFNQNQQGNGDLDDTNSDDLLGGGGVGQQFEQDAEKYEQELSTVAAKGGQKGSYSEKDAEVVEAQNKDKPWYQRLRSWTGKKLTQLANKVKGSSGYKREAYSYYY